MLRFPKSLRPDFLSSRRFPGSQNSPGCLYFESFLRCPGCLCSASCLRFPDSPGRPDYLSSPSFRHLRLVLQLFRHFRVVPDFPDFEDRLSFPNSQLEFPHLPKFEDFPCRQDYLHFLRFLRSQVALSVAYDSDCRFPEFRLQAPDFRFPVLATEWAWSKAWPPQSLSPHSYCLHPPVRDLNLILHSQRTCAAILNSIRGRYTGSFTLCVLHI